VRSNAVSDAASDEAQTGGLVHSQRLLLALTQKGPPREDGYRLVQRNAMKAWQEGGDFEKLLAADPDVRKCLTEAEIAANFDLFYHLSIRSSPGCSENPSELRLAAKTGGSNRAA
jgi:adenylosuccinate lyase